VRVRLRSNDGAIISGVAFRAMDRPLGQALLGGRGSAMHVAGTLSMNRWQGRETIEMRISDAASADPLAAR
jgi:single-stranded-DNA-specific exonuclease